MSHNVKGWVDVASVHYCPSERGTTLCGVLPTQIPRASRTDDPMAVTCKQCNQGLESIGAAIEREEVNKVVVHFQTEADRQRGSDFDEND